MADEANVKVFCRVRPPNEREGAFVGRNAASMATLSSSFVKKCVVVPASDPLQQTVFLQSRHASQNSAPKTFTFDRAFGEDSTQNDVFDVVGVPITQACLQGYNGTIFAYGQTGSGKTFTMQGPDHVIDMEANKLTERELSLRGLVPRVFDYLFEDVVAKDSFTNVQHTFACSFLEIYNERVYDLLDGGSTKDATGLQLRENGRKGVFVEGLIESVVTNAKQAAELMTVGAQNRRVGQTAMNRESSRSHSVFILQIQSKETTADGITKMRSSRFNLVDLAGSERQRNTEAAGERLKEAGSINKSLSALGNVIMGLVEQSAGKNRHVHYRDSKLTFLLKDSLGGNSKTFMIATISPAEDSSYETLSTLKFAQRAKLIRNNAIINEDSTGSVLVLQEEIKRLRRHLQQAQIESMNISLEPPLALPPSTASAEPSASDALLQCDPAIDGRFRELEAAFAATIEKNGQLKRSYEHLQLREEHLKSLCSEMKRNIAHLRMMLRLRNGRAVSSDEIDQEVMNYEPSVDAIEWRLKYDEVEENLAQLQDEIQQRRMSESFAGLDRTAHIEGEIENLNLMLLALTKQLAYVVRDKHDLQDRLQAFSKTVDDSSDADRRFPEAPVEDGQFLAQLQAALTSQAQEYDAKVNALSAGMHAAEEKARESSLELLQMKQKEAAWNIHDKERDIRLREAMDMTREAEQAKEVAEDLLRNEKQQHCEQALLAEREKDQMRLALESKFADLLTSNQVLVSEHESLQEEAKRLLEVRTHLEQISAGLADQIDSKISEINDLQSSYNDEVTARETLEASFDTYKARSSERVAELEKTLADKASSLVELQRNLERTIEAKNRELETLAESSEETRADLQEKLQAMANENSKLDSTIQDMKSEVAALEDRSATLLSDLSVSETRVSEKSREIESLQSSLSTASERLEGAEASILESEQVIDGLRASIATLEDTNKSVRRDLLSTHSELENLLMQKENAESELSQSKTQLGEVQEENSALADELDRVRAAFEEMRVLNRELESQLTTATSDIAALKESEAVLLDARAQLEGKLDESQTVLAETRQELVRRVEDHGMEVNRLHEESSAKIQQLTKDFECTIQSQGEQLKQLQSSFTDAMQQNEEKLADMQRSHQEQVLGMEDASKALQKEYDEKMSSLARDLTAVQEQRNEAVQSHDHFVANLRAAHAAEVEELRRSAQSSIGELKEDLSRSELVVKDKLAMIAKFEAEVEALVKASEIQKGETAQAADAALKQRDEKIRTLERSVVSEKEEKETKAQEFQTRVTALEADIDYANEICKSQRDELAKYVRAAEAMKGEIETLKRLESSRNAEHESELEVLHIRLKELEQQIETKNSAAIETEQAFHTEKRSLHQQVEEAEHELMKQTYASKELMRTGEQLGLTIEEQRTKLKLSKEKMVEMETELQRSAEAMRRAKSELSTKEFDISDLAAALAQLQSKHDALEQENTALKKDRQKKSDLTRLAEQLDRRSAEVEEKENRVESALKGAEQERGAAASARKEFEAIKDDYKKCRTRLEELEFLIIQLKNDKKKLEREVQMQSKRLENISNENDKLVGHDNKRQKIQYHFKVKEENNRLLGEVRQLTDEKFKLRTKLEKMKLALKEKENLGENLISKRPTPPGSKSSTTNTTVATARQTISKKLIPVSSGSGLESSSLSTPKPNKKRLHSRIERS